MNEILASAIDDIDWFFISSHAFNGIPLRQIGEDLGISYEDTIDVVFQLVSDDYCKELNLTERTKVVTRSLTPFVQNENIKRQYLW